MLMICTSLNEKLEAAIAGGLLNRPGLSAVHSVSNATTESEVKTFLEEEPSNRVLLLVDFAIERLGGVFDQGQEAITQAANVWVQQAQRVLNLHKLDRQRIRLVNVYSALLDPIAIKDEFHIQLPEIEISHHQSLGQHLMSSYCVGDVFEKDSHLRGCTRTYNEPALLRQYAKLAADYVAGLQTSVDAKNAELVKANVDLKECQEKLENVTNESNKLHKEKQKEFLKLAEENDLILKQLHKVQELFEAELKAKGDALAEVKSLKLEFDGFKRTSEKTLKGEQKKNDELSEKNDLIRKQLHEAKGSVKAEQTKNAELAEENELILSQLHLVQEELERYYNDLRSTKQLSESQVKKLQQLNETMQTQNRRFSRDKVKLDQVQQSISWKITKIFRAPIRLFPRVKVSEQVKLIQASDLFDEEWYLNAYPDVKKAGLDAAKHYIKHGGKEGRNPGPNFDTQWYVKQYPDVGARKMNPLVHYLLHGIEENRKVSPRLLTFQG